MKTFIIVLAIVLQSPTDPNKTRLWHTVASTKIFADEATCMAETKTRDQREVARELAIRVSRKHNNVAKHIYSACVQLTGVMPKLSAWAKLQGRM